MHALSRIHRVLRRGGVLLDLHPEPEDSRIKIWKEGQINHLGEVNQDQDAMEILEARSHLADVERRGWFVSGERQFFDLLGHYRTVDDWLDWWNEQGWTFSVEPELLDTARNVLATGGELVLRETIRATVLSRLPGPATGGAPHSTT